jgi:tetraacyldisaccharide 4'-kinase
MPKAPDFWWLKQPNWQARLLQPFGALYGALSARRMKAMGQFAGRPVICVGNFIAGGAGKTPIAIALASLMQHHHLQPMFITRGYGGNTYHSPHRVTEDDDYLGVGDEALLLNRTAPVIICIDRVNAAYAAAEQGADVVIMDDGLQNPALRKTHGLAVVDGMSGVGNGLCLPAGPLRAPLDAQWPFVSALIVMGPGEAGDQLAAQAGARAIPVFRADLVASIGTLDYLRQRPVLAFAGIGRPTKFFNTLSSHGVKIMEHLAFPDHHAYSARDIDLIMRRARKSGATIAVTTEKDLVRIPAHLRNDERAALMALPVEARFRAPEQLAAFFNLS